MKPRDRSRRFFSRPLTAASFGAQARHLPRWFWLALGGWLAWVTVISEHSFWRIARLQHQVASAERDSHKLNDDTDRLGAQVGDAEAKRFRAEEIARTQHGWMAPGELVYKFRGDDAADSTR
jgi:cell division protein FtsB